MKPLILLPFVATVALLLGACGGGDPANGAASVGPDATGAGDLAPDSTADVAPAPLGAFTADAPTGTTFVATAGTFAPTGLLTVDVTLTGFKDLYGVAGHLHYDPAHLELVNIEGKSPLVEGSYDNPTVARKSPAGRVLLGTARLQKKTGKGQLQAPTGIDLAGTALWARLTFKPLAAGSSRVEFAPGDRGAFDSQKVLIKAEFLGGKVVTTGGAN